MTLILTALCKNGICACADKRNQTWTGSIKTNTDNLNKIFHFKSAPIIIFNHGVNKFDGKFWDSYCEEYENTGRWKDKGLKDIAEDFRSFIEQNILVQLNENIRNFPDNTNVTASAYVICGKDIQSGKYEFYELFWSPTFSFNKHSGLIRTGDGKKYLDEYINKNVYLNTIDYWEKITVLEAIEKLKELYSIALNGQKADKGDIFSDNYDIDSVLD